MRTTGAKPLLDNATSAVPDEGMETGAAVTNGATMAMSTSVRDTNIAAFEM